MTFNPFCQKRARLFGTLPRYNRSRASQVRVRGRVCDMVSQRLVNGGRARGNWDLLVLGGPWGRILISLLSLFHGAHLRLINLRTFVSTTQHDIPCWTFRVVLIRTVVMVALLLMLDPRSNSIQFKCLQSSTKSSTFGLAHFLFLFLLLVLGNFCFFSFTLSCLYLRLRSSVYRPTCIPARTGLLRATLFPEPSP